MRRIESGELRKQFIIFKLSIIIFTFSIFLLSSCATISRNTAQRDTGDFSLLPQGGQLYLWAQVNEARDLLDSISFEGMQLSQAKVILDRTNTAAAVFFGTDTDNHTPGSVSRFFLNLRGNFPSFQAGLSFTFSRDWKRLRSITGNSFWQSEGMGLGIAMNKDLALVTAGDPYLLLPANSRIPAVIVPDGFDEFRKASALSGWIPDNEPVNKFLSDLGIPIQIPAEDFFFKAHKLTASVENHETGNDEWELEFLIRTPSANHSQGLLMLFSLARPFIMSLNSGEDRSSIMNFIPALFANQPSRNGNELMLRSAPFTTMELALLFNIISLYSHQ